MLPLFKSKSKNAQPKVQETLRERFKNKENWKNSVKDLVVWFMFGGLITTMLSMYSPGYPIIVGTPSIQTGIYWLNRTDRQFVVDDLVTFEFKPAQKWIQERYVTDKLIHTKLVVGTAGDIIMADADLNMKVCRKEYSSGDYKWCRPIGKPQAKDSVGRELFPWLAAGTSYVLQPGELWINGQHIKSLDSRYHGPIHQSAITGKSKLVIPYGAAPEMEIPLENQQFMDAEPFSG